MIHHKKFMPAITSQARYWILTIKHADFTPYLPAGISYIKGQLERGGDTGYLHWQVLVHSSRKLRLGGLKAIFGNTIHAEPTRSSAANGQRLGYATFESQHRGQVAELFFSRRHFL